MQLRSTLQRLLTLSALLICALLTTQAQTASNVPLPDPRQLIQAVEQHQSQLDKIRENYSYRSLQTVEAYDNSGKLLKTVTEQRENFFVNGHLIQRTVEKDGRTLSERDQQKETARITKLAEKAEKTPSSQPLSQQSISLSQLLKLVDLHNPRREGFRGRNAFVVDFTGRKDAKASGMIENLSQKIQGTLWIDEQFLQVSRAEFLFNENFRIAGGLFFTMQKGSRLSFDQGLINGELWLPVSSDANINGKFLMMKNLHLHVTERHSNYQRFRVETLHTQPTVQPAR